jgi:hypothetical protein
MMIDYNEALRQMHGNVVKYVGTVNGNVMSDNGARFLYVSWLYLSI